MSTGRLGKLVLDKCEREGGSTIDPYALTVVDNNETPFDNDIPMLNKKFHSQNFSELPRNCKILKSFQPRKIPAFLLYGTVWRRGKEKEGVERYPTCVQCQLLYCTTMYHDCMIVVQVYTLSLYACTCMTSVICALVRYHIFILHE